MRKQRKQDMSPQQITGGKDEPNILLCGNQNCLTLI